MVLNYNVKQNPGFEKEDQKPQSLPEQVQLDMEEEFKGFEDTKAEVKSKG
jgi:hypothetical protein